MPELTRALLERIADSTTLIEAEGLVERQAVKNCKVTGNVITGMIYDAGRKYFPRIMIHESGKVQSKCGCPAGKIGRVCMHALALCLHELDANPKQPVRNASTATNKTSVLKKSNQSLRDLGQREVSQLLVDGSPQYLSIQLPATNQSYIHELRKLLGDYRFQLEASSRQWRLRDNHRVLNFLADHYRDLKDRFQAEFSDNFRNHFDGLHFAEASVSLNECNDETVLELNLTAETPMEEIKTEIQRGKRYLVRDDKITLVPQKTLETLKVVERKLTGSSHTTAYSPSRIPLQKAQMIDLQTILKDEGLDSKLPNPFKEETAALRNLSKLKEAPIQPQLNETLRVYQKVGVAWMYHLYREGLAGLLADEMGLGKTLQTLALIQAIRKTNRKSVLVVCPAGLVENWAREVQKFTPELAVYRHHGTARSLDELSKLKAHIVITSYGTLVRDIDVFLDQEYALVIGDEAQHIKNAKTQHALAIKRLKSYGRVLLTGTPIENRIEDLSSLFGFLLPGYLLDKKRGEGDRAWLEQRIRSQAAPYILRRTKRQVAPELPAKIEQVFYCEMGEVQRKLYEDFRRKSQGTIYKLLDQGANEGQVKIATFTELLRLRQICTDPRLLKREDAVAESAKQEAFFELLDNCMDDGHRVLVFSQFTSMLALLRQSLETKAIEYCYIDGSTKNRLAEADRFNESEIPVFLISLKAGGTGLNLTGADTVIHYDPWWNPAAEAQATDRAHRIGQKQTVTSYKLIVSGTVEEKVLELQNTKRDLLQGLFEEAELGSSQLELNTLQELLNVSFFESNNYN